MLPRWHILLGLIFSLLAWIIFPSFGGFYVLLMFLSSVFIDFDHYMCAVWATGKIGLFDSFKYNDKLREIEKEEYKKKIFRKGDFYIFHTIEFHLLILALGLLWTGFYFIFIGMLLHSLTDLIDNSIKKKVYRREYFLAVWVAKKCR